MCVMYIFMILFVFYNIIVNEWMAPSETIC